jgi:hypothetical protein
MMIWNDATWLPQLLSSSSSTLIHTHFANLLDAGYLFRHIDNKQTGEVMLGVEGFS